MGENISLSNNGISNNSENLDPSPSSSDNTQTTKKKFADRDTQPATSSTLITEPKTKTPESNDPSVKSNTESSVLYNQHLPEGSPLGIVTILSYLNILRESSPSLDSLKDIPVSLPSSMHFPAPQVLAEWPAEIRTHVSPSNLWAVFQARRRSVSHTIQDFSSLLTYLIQALDDASSEFYVYFSNISTMVENTQNVVSSLVMGIDIDLSRAQFPLWATSWLNMRNFRSTITNIHIRNFNIFLDPQLHAAFTSGQRDLFSPLTPELNDLLKRFYHSKDCTEQMAGQLDTEANRSWLNVSLESPFLLPSLFSILPNVNAICILY